MGSMVKMFDGLRNLVAGLGGAQSKAAAATYMLKIPTRQEIDACYRSTWLGRQIHDVPALDMTREWRAWQAEDDQIEAIENEEKRLQLRVKVRRAIVLAKLYGGSALILGLPGDPAKPAPETIGKGQLKYVHLVHRYDLTLGNENRNLLDEGFGRPVEFQLNTRTDAANGQVPIHPSRVVAFTGSMVPEGAGMGGEDWFWGDPLLAAVFDALTTHDTGVAAIAELLNEAKVDVVHIPGLMDNMVAPEYEAALVERFTLAAMIKSLNNALVLDGGDGTGNNGERWETRTVDWKGLPEIQQTLFQLVAGAADIPATRLIGMSPSGMNATGESDIRNYYDMLSSLQNSDVTPILAPLDERLIMSATGARDPSIFYDWRPLWQMSPKEKAERDKLDADTADKYANMGVIPDDAFAVSVQNKLVENSVFPGLEAALEEAEQQARLEIPPEEREPGPGEMPEAANDPNPAGPEPAKQAALGKGRGSATTSMAGNSKRRAANDRARRYMTDRHGRAELLLTDAVPRTLYVSRKLLNAAEVRKWAKGQGFTNLTPADKMHVTIAASREAVDWLKVGSEWGSDSKGNLDIKPGGARMVEPLGDHDAPVLLFNSSELSWRHEEIKRAGASWDFSEFQPHVTISYEGVADDFDWSAVEPFRGALEFGPEIFEEFDADWSPDKSE